MSEQQDYAAIVAKYSDPYANAEEFSDWVPPVGEYTAIVDAVRSGALKDGGHPYWSVNAKLADGVDENGESAEGKKFQLAFLSLSPGREGLFKSFVKSINGGQSEDDLGAAIQLVNGLAGTVVRVAVKLDKTGKYKNAYIQEVLASEEAPA